MQSVIKYAPSMKFIGVLAPKIRQIEGYLKSYFAFTKYFSFVYFTL